MIRANLARDFALNSTQPFCSTLEKKHVKNIGVNLNPITAS